MKFIEKNIKGVYEIQLEPKEDMRGYFMRVYDDNIYKKHGLHRNWVHENHSFSKYKNTVRGFHFQYPPYTETKLVRVVRGKVFDVYVDIRKDSPTFMKWGSTIISAENKKMLYLPKGIAHGMCTMEANSIMVYKVDNYYASDHEGKFKWDDPKLNINWPIDGEVIVSKKDSEAISFLEFLEKNPEGI
jgi:dTDP-4-dehydrorhamnose 3,5-epimerase